MLKLNLIHTVAFSGLVLFIGYGLRRLIRPLERVNIPAPVVGGLLVACLTLVARRFDLTLFEFDTTLRDPLMIAFFTTIGFGASVSLLKKGGRQVLIFFGVATVFAVLQNVLGILIALPSGSIRCSGVLAGSVTLTGGPATGLAFAPLFEKAGVTGAATDRRGRGHVRHRLRRPDRRPDRHAPHRAAQAEKSPGRRSGRSKRPPPRISSRTRWPSRQSRLRRTRTRRPIILLKNLVVILAAMWAGSWLSSLFTRHRLHPAGLYRRDARRRRHPQFRRLDRLARGSRSGRIDDIGHVALRSSWSSP